MVEFFGISPGGISEEMLGGIAEFITWVIVAENPGELPARSGHYVTIISQLVYHVIRMGLIHNCE